ncbi:MAG: glycosyltransferase family 2 protein [Candidatus Sumerlaeia bacterium]|nr:glycosyltransferase family 2 protein [Candidatus Sumerlaeia bacterium]
MNWNKRDYLRNLLGSLRTLGGTPFDIVVVDNASTDGSPDMVRTEFPECALVETGRNVGGSGGFNAGMLHGLAHPKKYHFFWLMDNDIVVKPGALDALLEQMLSDRRIAVVGSAILVLGEEGQVQEIGARVNWVECSMPKNGEGPFAEVPRPHVYECDYASACSCLARVSAIRKVGIWDPDYFVQMDDIEWGARLKRAGYRIVATTESQVCHERFDDRRATQGPAMSYLVARNWFHLFRKNAPRATVHASLRKLFRLFLAGADNAESAGRHGEAFAYRLALRDFLEGRRGAPPQELFAFKPPADADKALTHVPAGRVRRIALMTFDNPEMTLAMAKRLKREFPGAKVETILFDPKPYMASAPLPGKRILTIRSLRQRIQVGLAMALRYDVVASPRHGQHFIFKELAPLQILFEPDTSWKAYARQPRRLIARAINRVRTPMLAEKYARQALARPVPPVNYHPFRS